AYAARARRAAARDQWPAEQAGCRGARYQRGHPADPPQQDHAEDAGGVACRPGADCREAADPGYSFQTFRKLVSMSTAKSLVAIVDDAPRLLESLEELLESAGHAVRAFSSAQTLLDSDALPDIDCLITDIGMPGMNGFDLQSLVSERRPDLPVFLITGRHEL